MVSGQYGLILRNDGNHTFMLLTNADDQYGSWNNLRPFRIKNSTGDVYLGENLEVAKKVQCQNAREHVSANDIISTDSFDYVDMDGMGLNIVTAINPVLVLFKVPTVRSTENGGWCFFRLLVDDNEVAVSHHHITTSPYGTHEVTLTWMGVLSEGEHTIKGQWRRESGETITACGWGGQSSGTKYTKNVTRHLIAIEL
jgi:hypothetical protein